MLGKICVYIYIPFIPVSVAKSPGRTDCPSEQLDLVGLGESVWKEACMHAWKTD